MISTIITPTPQAKRPNDQTTNNITHTIKQFGFKEYYIHKREYPLVSIRTVFGNWLTAPSTRIRALPSLNVGSVGVDLYAVEKKFVYRRILEIHGYKQLAQPA